MGTSFQHFWLLHFSFFHSTWSFPLSAPLIPPLLCRSADFQAAGAAPAPAPAKAPAPAQKSAPTPDGPGAATAALIVAKGEEIRKLKADKADKAALEVRGTNKFHT